MLTIKSNSFTKCSKLSKVYTSANPDFKSLNLSHSLIIVAQVISSIIRLKKSKYLHSNNSFFEFDFQKPVIIILGSEKDGISGRDILLRMGGT